MEYLLIIMGLMLIASGYANYNMLKKQDILEERVGELQRFIGDFSDNLSLVDSHMTEIDTRGMFAADDDVGYAFKSIKLIISKLQDFNINYVDKKEE